MYLQSYLVNRMSVGRPSK